MKKQKIIFLISFICMLSSCAHLNNKKIADYTSAILSESPGALEAVLETFRKADIVFIGGSTHQLLNDKLFINQNLQRFYDAGVRYILAEGGMDEGPVYSDEWLLKKAYLLFFPWEYVGVRYGASDLRNEIYKLNLGKSEEDKIKLVGLESGRQNFTPETYEYFKVMNYRDEYMAKTAFDYINNAKHGEKFLVIAGGSHGITETVSFSGSNTWKPLGAYLKEKYDGNFFSLCYITLDENIKGDNQYQKLLNSNEWQMSIAEPFMKKAQEIFPYELWTDYWYAKMYMKANDHKKAYDYLKTILDNPLIYSMQIYPEILELAVQCAEKLKLFEQADKYRNQKAALHNEYSIDVNRFSLILD